MSSLIHPILPTSNVKETSATRVRPLGSLAVDAFGGIYRWVKVKSAITGPGFLLTPQLNAIAAADAITAYNATTGRITDNTAVTVDAGELAGALLYTRDNTGEGQLGVVKQNPALTAAALQVDLVEPFATDLDTTTDINICNPWVVDLTTTAETQAVVGVSVGAVTDEYYCWMQCKGYALVQVSGAAIAVNSRLIPGTTAGKAIVWDSASATENDFAKVLIAAESNDTGHLCLLYCLGT